MINSVGWSPVGRPPISVVTAFRSRSMVMTREVLFPPPDGAPRAPWLESVPNRVPPPNPRSKARPMAGPSTWKLPLAPVFGLPIGPLRHPPSKFGRPARQFPRLSKMVRSGVNGLLAGPPAMAPAESLLLQLPGKPLPDSITRTWKLFLLPLNAIPVGWLRPFANTDARKPLGRAMSWPWSGLKKAVLAGQFGLTRICADAGMAWRLKTKAASANGSRHNRETANMVGSPSCVAFPADGARDAGRRRRSERALVLDHPLSEAWPVVRWTDRRGLRRVYCYRAPRCFLSGWDLDAAKAVRQFSRGSHLQ